MSAQLDSRLVETLRRRAEMAADGPRFAVEDILGAGRTARRRRRARRVAAAALTTVVVLLAAGGVLAAVRQPSRHPVQPGPASPTPDLIAGNVLIRADGLRTSAVLPSGWRVTYAVRIPTGWVVGASWSADGRSGPGVWLLPDGGEARRIGTLGDFQVSPTGGMLTGIDDTGTVVVYTLPGLVKIDQLTVGHPLRGDTIWVAGISRSGLVLIDDRLEREYQSPSAVWNPATGAVIASTAHVQVWGITDDGQVLRSTVDDEYYGCIDLVTVGATIPSDATGLCRAHSGARLSPDGQWVVLHKPAEPGHSATPVLLRASDIRAGRWRPIALENAFNTTIMFWDSATTFLLGYFRPGHADYLRCDLAGRCRLLDLPEELTSPRPVPRFGP